jgi:hypothetical protein
MTLDQLLSEEAQEVLLLSLQQPAESSKFVNISYKI